MNALSRNWFWILGVLVLGAICYYFADIVTYLLIAWVLSMLGQPLMVFFLKHLRFGKIRIGTGVAAMLTILTFYGIITGLLLIFVPTMVTQARNLANVDYNALGEKLRGPFTWLDVQMHQLGLIKTEESLGTRTQELLLGWFKPTLLGDFVGSFFGVAGNIVVLLSSVTFILFFFLKENKLFTGIIHAFVPNDLEPKVRRAVQDSNEVLSRYFGGLVLQLLIFSACVTVFLWLFGIDNAILIGVSGGIFNVIPYVGPILGMIFACFITVSSHVDGDLMLLLPMLLKVIATFALTQFIDNMIVSTIIFSKSVQAHPLEIFIVTLIAAKIGGVVGMVVGIPVYTVLRVVARVFFSEFKFVQRLTHHLDEPEEIPPEEVMLE